MKDKLLNWLNLALIGDIFFVFFSFFWLVLGLLGRATGIPLGLDVWYKLWQPVFLPAIGVLMGGALLSAVINQINQRLFSRQV